MARGLVIHLTLAAGEGWYDVRAFGTENGEAVGLISPCFQDTFGYRLTQIRSRDNYRLFRLQESRNLCRAHGFPVLSSHAHAS